MSLLRSLLKDQRMTAVELFKRIDRNHSGEISLVELRSGLLDLGFKLGDIVLVMKVFDKNLNGSIEEQEFLNQFDGVKTECMYIFLFIKTYMSYMLLLFLQF